MKYQIDHIDPRWKKGRDYQLVCGLDVPLNFEEREESVNKSKNNRFLPWRIAKDELGVVPVNPGDMCLFLVGADIEKDIPGEWVLLEFMGEEWYFHTKSNCGPNFPGKSNWGGKIGGRTNAINKTGVCGRSSRKMTEDGRLGGLIQGPIAVKAGTGIHSKFMCLQTGFISNPGTLANWQRKRGIDLSKRVELTPEEKAFIFLWDN
jgi:hypothetical protein